MNQANTKLSFYIAVFFAFIASSIILFFILGLSINTGLIDGLVFVVGIIITCQSAFIVAFLFYIRDLIKKRVS